MISDNVIIHLLDFKTSPLFISYLLTKKRFPRMIFVSHLFFHGNLSPFFLLLRNNPGVCLNPVRDSGGKILRHTKKSRGRTKVVDILHLIFNIVDVTFIEFLLICNCSIPCNVGILIMILRKIIYLGVRYSGESFLSGTEFSAKSKIFFFKKKSPSAQTSSMAWLSEAPSSLNIDPSFLFLADKIVSAFYRAFFSDQCFTESRKSSNSLIFHV